MSQLSQISGLSDLIPDVDTFIEENDMTEDMQQLFRDDKMNVHHLQQKLRYEEEEDFKPAPEDFFETPDRSPLELAYPPEQPSNLCNDEYPGPLNFEVLIVPNEHKTPWEYSARLNKIFIGMNLKFPVAFSLKNRPPEANLFIRATPIFCQPQFFQEPVHRCVGHQHPQDPSNVGISEHIYPHILRCTNDDVRYFGSKEGGSRLNLVMPLGSPQAGTDFVKEFFYFVCKNSCPLGMNRRALQVVFSLEDESGAVMGRRIVSVRVCSCPKRDKEKEEKDMTPVSKKRQLPRAGARRPTPGNSSQTDTKVYSLNIDIVGRRNYQDTVDFIHKTMAAEILKREGQNGADAPFRRCATDALALLTKMSND